MALFDFLKKNNKFIRCARCSRELTSGEAVQHNGQSYCTSCYTSILSASQPVGTRTAERPKTVEKPRVVEQSDYAGDCHPAIADIKQTFDKANLNNKVIHAGSQWELHASISGKANSYVLKYIMKETGKGDLALRIFKLANVPENRRMNVYPVLNSLQRQYRFVRFNLDSDGDVNLEYDLPNCTTGIGGIALEMLLRIMKIVDDIYPELMKALWS